MKRLFKYSSLAIYFTLFVVFVRLLELFKLKADVGFNLWNSFDLAIANDLMMACFAVIIISPFYFFIPKKNELFSRILFALALLLQILLTHYFIESFELLDGIILNFSLSEIGIIIASSSENLEGLDYLILALEMLFLALLFILPIRESKTSLVLFLGVLLFAAFNSDGNYEVLDNQVLNRVYPNKTTYFANGIYQKLSYANRKITYSDEQIKTAAKEYQTLYNKNYTGLTYPFENTSNTPNVLGPFFPSNTTKPNVVIIAIESMSRVFSGKNADLASFTPFLDSLTNHSLYWSNCLSNAKKTSGIFSNYYSSAPYGNERGLVNIEYSRPKHNSIINLLQSNGYKTNFYYGGNLDFDNMKNYLYEFKLSKMVEENDFKTPNSHNYSLLKNNEFGYADEVLYNEYITNTSTQSPRLDMLLTLSLHCNFKNLTDYDSLYFKTVKNIDKKKFEKFTKEYLQAKGDWELTQNYEYILKTVLYVDNSLRKFFEAYKKRPDFTNTIFIIAGDHYIHRFPLKNVIQNRHVPLWIYSPMLTRVKQSNTMVMHNDIIPSITTLLANNFNLKLPAKNHWLGMGLDTNATFKATRKTALQDDKVEHHTYIYNNWVYDKEVDKLYLVDSLLNLTEQENPAQKKVLKKHLTNFNILNEYVVKKNKIIE